MFLSELLPVIQKYGQQPLAFTGGFFSGVFQLKLNEPPLSDWLVEQGYSPTSPANVSSDSNNSKPQSISID
ncbi:hypothetical protein [Myxosarcina sp. GI1]|uniref:hypothetical protein n=1 Tax=Myxosarcina sp. GI1 TaxID=1541065 RepID=UPI00055A5BE2|nr:hypothetical protein [Myxosarcina sp. GI1]